MAKYSIASRAICMYLLAALMLATNLGPASAFSEEENNESTKQSAVAGANNLELTVDDINDLGLALQRIKQQAINIYIEAMRHKHSTEVKGQVPNLTAVPNQFPKTQSSLLPFRRPWLVYFITTLEPLVHLLKEDLKDIENGSKTADLPAEIRKALQPLIKDWAQYVLKIDRDLSNATQLIEDADKNNIALAKIAYEIDGSVNKLEQIREKAFYIIHDKKQAHKKHKTGKTH